MWLDFGYVMLNDDYMVNTSMRQTQVIKVPSLMAQEHYLCGKRVMEVDLSKRGLMMCTTFVENSSSVFP